MKFREHPGVDPDIGNAYATAMNAARQQQMRLLAPEECDGLGGADRDAHHCPGGAINAARQVNAENGAPLALIASIMSCGSPFTDRLRPAPNSASIISAGLPIA